MLKADYANISPFYSLTEKRGENDMKGNAYHRKDCPRCKAGDTKTLEHPYWYVQVYLPYLPKKLWKMWGRKAGQGFKDGIDAIRFLAEIQPAIEEKKFFPEKYSKHPMSQFIFRNWFKVFADKRNNIQGAKKYFPAMDDLDLREMDHVVVNRFYQNLPEHLAPGTKGLIMSTLHACLSEAWRNGLIQALPPFPRLPSALQKEKRWLTREEQQQIISTVPGKYKLYFLFLACHGVRPGEALALRWEQFDHKRKTVRIVSTKTNKENIIPLHSEFLKEIKTFCFTGKVFPKMCHRRVLQILHQACAEAEIPRTTLHEFSRHSFISQRINQGLSREQVALITDNLSAMRAYTHVSLETKKRIIEG